MDSVPSEGSYIDNYAFNYIHHAWDYRAGGDSWADVGVLRVLRSRDSAMMGSFGPEQFCQYDIKLMFIDQVSTYGAFLFNPADVVSQHVLHGSNAQGTLQFFDDEEEELIPGSGGPVNFSNVETVLFTLKSGELYRFEVIQTEFGFTPTYDARLIRFQDRRGYGTTITYKTWSGEEIEEAPDRQWQIDEVTSDHGQTLTFHYAEEQVGGRWVVEEIELPNEDTITYEYENDRLHEVTRPDSSVSSFEWGYVPNPIGFGTGLDSVTIVDPVAPDLRPEKSVYFTPQFVYTAYGDPDDSRLELLNIINSPSHVVRTMITGDEVTYLNINDPLNNSGTEPLSRIYEGQGRLKEMRWVNGTSSCKFYKDGWTVTPLTDTVYMGMEIVYVGLSAPTGTLDDGDEFIYGGSPNMLGAPAQTVSEQGTTVEYQYDTDGWISFANYPDDTFEAYCYNSFHQITRYRDRLGRVTRYTYDARGNVLTKAVGLTDHPSNVPGEYGGGYDRCATNDVETDEYALYEWEYYPEMHADQFLLKASTDANGNVTDYEYDTNHRLKKIISPPDEEMGDRPETEYFYDAAGRVETILQPGGWGTDYEYDDANRPTKVIYADGSTERYFYGTGAEAGLIVKKKDRAGLVTDYTYDSAGRIITTVVGATTMDLADDETAVADPSLTTTEVCTYVPGTRLKATCVRSGEKTTYAYDYRHRLVGTTVQPRTGTPLTSTNTYVNNQLFKTTDPYGRSTFYAYDATDGRLIRTVRGMVPSYALADYEAVLEEERDPEDTPNPLFTITDYFHDAEGQTTQTTDPRGFEHTTAYDSRGRTTEQIRAAGTAIEAKTVTLYDDNSNVVETRSPRYFDSTDTEGYEQAFTTLTYTGRNLLKTRTEAPGSAIEATESFTYNLDGKQLTHTDFRGKIWTTVYTTCCNRPQSQIDPLGHGKIVNYDSAGRLVHEAVVSEVSTHTTPLNPTDGKTLRETTTRYDARGRVVAQTVWLVARGTIDPEAPPIAGEDMISASDGLTTRYQYDDDLDDETGLDDTFASHLTGLNLGTDSDGSAVLVTNPEGERTLSISDGLGRTVRKILLAANDDALLQQTTAYDAVVAIGGYGDVVETTATNLLSHTTKQRTNAAGHVLQVADALNKITAVQYDANGNRLQTRDPNSVGTDTVFDALNRQLETADTQEQANTDHRAFVYNRDGQVIEQIDADENSSTVVYDARGRQISATDRLTETTAWTYDQGLRISKCLSCKE